MQKTVKSILCATTLILAVSVFSGCTNNKTPAEKTEAVHPETKKMIYLGVENYGAEETNKDNKDQFRYRFSDDGKEVGFSIDNGKKDAGGVYDYPIQNALKEGYVYTVTFQGETVTAAEEIEDGGTAYTPYTPPVSGKPGELTLENFLRTAMMPVGTTLYIYGGGWNWQDDGSAVQTRTIGVSPDWIRFFEERDENFTYKGKDGDEENVDASASYYPFGGYNEYYYAGLDCSGYVGWTLYNTFQTESGKEGYVGGSTGFAKRLADQGLGTWTQDVAGPAEAKAEAEAANETEAAAGNESDDPVVLPGDIMSLNGHVWISLGTCDDGSVVILHSTPSYSRTGQPGGGVQISAIGQDESCEAYTLADRYMAEYFPKWYGRYPAALKKPENYFHFEGEKAGLFRWNTGEGGKLSDPAGVQKMQPEEVLELLFGMPANG